LGRKLAFRLATIASPLRRVWFVRSTRAPRAASRSRAAVNTRGSARRKR
jgi:hypothetical protein